MATPAGRSRRRFLSTVGLATTAFTIVPRHVLGRGFQAPSDRLNIAAVGVGGRGRAVITNMVGENLVAMCDVDWGYADQGFTVDLPKDISRLEERIADNVVEVRAPASARNEGAPPAVTTRPMTPLERSRAIGYAGRQRTLTGVAPKAARYQDFRRMLDQQKDIDAVVVATPDHLHASVALAAMDLGKHVYVEKPLCWSVAEARLLAKRAAETKVATQMGNQGHSTDDGRMVVEYLQAGTLGEVTEVHVWTNRPLGFWPQGVPRPAATTTPADGMRWNGPGITARLGAAMGHYPKPEGLAWDLFLGPAPYVEYHPVYHPFNWRGWVDWGAGPLGDMGAHLIDHAYWGLELGLPTTIETVSTPFNNVSFPHATMTFYEFAARGRQPAVRMTWYDGGLLPPKPAEMGGEEFNPGGGALVIGTKGKLMYENYGSKPRLLPASLHESVGTPARTLARIADENHEMNWVEAAKGLVPVSSPFEYAAKLTEVMLLGIVSLRAGKKLAYDAANMHVTNDADANEFLTRVPRDGWSTR